MKQEGLQRVGMIAILLLVIFTSFGNITKQLGTFVEVGTNLALTTGGTVPAVPTQFNAVTGACGGQVNLSWQASSGATSYEIYSNPGGKRPQVTGTSFVDTNLNPDATYGYQIRALIEGTLMSAWTLPAVSVKASSVCSPTEVPPKAPAPTITLSASPISIVSGNPSTLTWSSANATSCTASGGWSGAKNTSGSESVSPTNTSTYTLTCSGSGGSGSQSVSIAVTPPPPPIAKFKIGDSVKTNSNLNIRSTPGGSRLGQQSNGATGVVVSGPVLGKESQIWWNVDFTNAPDGWAVETYLDKATVAPPPPLPTVTISATPSSINSGDSATVIWSSTNATSCTASGGWTGTKSISGTEVVSPTTDTTYTLSCSGAGGSANGSATVSVTVMPPSTKFKIGDSIQTNSSVNVRAGANGSLLGTQSIDSLGSVSGGPVYTGGFHWWNIDYTNSPDGWSVEDFLDKYVVLPPTITFSANPASITSGNSSTLSWFATNTTSCTASGGWTGSKTASGSQSVTPTSNTTYILTCSGNGGTVTQSVTVAVSSVSSPVTFSASPTVITPGSSATLTWSAPNAVSCNASNGWSGSQNISGSTTVSPTAVNTTYFLSCIDSTGKPTYRSVTVSVSTTGSPIVELPRTKPTYPSNLESLPCTVNVPVGGLQQAISNAKGNAVLCLTPGSVHTGRFIFPARASTDTSGWIVLRTDPSAQLPSGRMTPTLAAPLAKIITPNTLAAMEFSSRSARVMVMGVEITSDSKLTTGPTNLIIISSLNEKLASDLPSDIVFDRTYVHGWPTQHFRRAWFASGKGLTFTRNWCEEIHMYNADSQCILFATTPGPALVEDNHLSAASENIMFGGADPTVPGTRNSDITVRRNHIYKPDSWMGKQWNIKNLIESKNSQRVLIEENVFSGNWYDNPGGAPGHAAVVLKSTNQNGSCPGCSTSDWTVRRNKFERIGVLASIAGRADSSSGFFTFATNERFLFSENWSDMVSVPPYTNQNRPNIIFTAENYDVTLDRNSIAGAQALESGMLFDLSGNIKVPVVNLKFTNNVIPKGKYGVGASSLGEGLPAWKAGALGNSTWTNNAIIGSSGATYPVGTTWHGSVASALGVAGVSQATVDAGVAGVVVAP